MQKITAIWSVQGGLTLQLGKLEKFTRFWLRLTRATRRSTTGIAPDISIVSHFDPPHR